MAGEAVTRSGGSNLDLLGLPRFFLYGSMYCVVGYLNWVIDKIPGKTFQPPMVAGVAVTNRFS